ncbi:hypothetical protein [Propionispira arboris]|uniref:hypothetical protein n=1 Tax=Propionispira arboris TaxID=84035 RepID=UPI000B89F625|nr:hypothetical protein [Propionispira arboris]
MLIPTYFFIKTPDKGSQINLTAAKIENFGTNGTTTIVVESDEFLFMDEPYLVREYKFDPQIMRMNFVKSQLQC